MLNEKEKKFLLKLARDTLMSYAKDKKLPRINEKEIPKSIKERLGVFVSLHEDHELRGCIGYIQPIKELYRAVTENVVNAAFRDTRFSPLSLDEIPRLKIEISVLSEPRKLVYRDWQDLLKKLKPEVHGVILEKKPYSATFLPQVWEHFSNNKEEFLSQLCVKAGLYPSCWKEESINVYVYTAEIFSE